MITLLREEVNMDNFNKDEYNAIPVSYCKDCLSLKVMRVAKMDKACYCDNCGGTDIEEIGIDTWEDLYKKKYGFSYLNDKY